MQPPPPRAPELRGPAGQHVVEHRHPHDEARSAPASSTSASAESATRGSISTPRFIGPGCITFWPGAQPLGRDAPARACTRAGSARSSRPPPCARAACAGRRRRRRRAIAPMSVVVSAAQARAAAAPAGRRACSATPTSAKRLDQRARDARVEDVADDRDVQALEPAERLLDRVEVEQRLRRVLVLAVAGVDDVRLGHPRDELRRADLRVADHDHVRVVGAERERGVLQRLALVHRRAGGLDAERVGGEPLRGELEARRGARRGLVEEVDDEAALAASAASSPRARARARTCARAEQALDVVAVEVGDREQVAARRRPGRAQLVADDDGSSSSRLLLRRGDRAGRRRPRPPRRAAPGCARRARSAGSCRRSRGGSAARGGRGRRGRRAGRAPGGRSRRAPRSRRGSCGPCRGRRRRG